jgi:hypothetical protein
VKENVEDTKAVGKIIIKAKIKPKKGRVKSKFGYRWRGKITSFREE